MRSLCPSSSPLPSLRPPSSLSPQGLWSCHFAGWVMARRRWKTRRSQMKRRKRRTRMMTTSEASVEPLWPAAAPAPSACPAAPPAVGSSPAPSVWLALWRESDFSSSAAGERERDGRTWRGRDMSGVFLSGGWALKPKYYIMIKLILYPQTIYIAIKYKLSSNLHIWLFAIDAEFSGSYGCDTESASTLTSRSVRKGGVRESDVGSSLRSSPHCSCNRL